MYCWNVRNYSWIVAIFHLVLGLLAAVIFITFLCLPESEKAQIANNYDRKKNLILFTYISLSLYCLAVVGCSIALIVGLKRNRYQLFLPFICVVYVGLLCNLILTGRTFFWDIRHKRPFAEIALDLFTSVALAGIQAVLLYPVYTHYRQLRSAPLRPELKQGFNTNAPISKPYFVESGQT